MSKPRRGTEAVFFDTFADWDIADQAAALRVLETLHRQKKREKQPRPVDVVSAGDKQPKLLESE